MSDCIPIAPFGDRPVVCVASGPSLSLAQAWKVGQARARDLCRVIAVNDSIYPCWFADIAYACDRAWWDEHRGLPTFGKLKLSLEPTGFADVRALRNTGIEGFEEAPGALRSGSNSGYQAVHLAAKLGATRIVLAGYDFTDDGARDHWFGRHRPGMDKHSNVAEWRRLFRGLTDELARRGVSVVNASLRTTIDWLPGYDVGHLVEDAQR